MRTPSNRTLIWNINFIFKKNSSKLIFEIVIRYHTPCIYLLLRILSQQSIDFVDKEGYLNTINVPYSAGSYRTCEGNAWALASTPAISIEYRLLVESSWVEVIVDRASHWNVSLPVFMKVHHQNKNITVERQRKTLKNRDTQTEIQGNLQLGKYIYVAI